MTLTNLNKIQGIDQLNDKQKSMMIIIINDIGLGQLFAVSQINKRLKDKRCDINCIKELLLQLSLNRSQYRIRAAGRDGKARLFKMIEK